MAVADLITDTAQVTVWPTALMNTELPTVWVGSQDPSEFIKDKDVWFATITGPGEVLMQKSDGSIEKVKWSWY